MAESTGPALSWMKNVLFFVESLSVGGAEKVLTTLLRHLDPAKYQITLLTLVDIGVLRDEIDKRQINYKTVIQPSPNPLISLWNKLVYKLIYSFLPSRLACKCIIPQKGIDLYVAFTEGFATKLLSFAPGPKIAWVHTDLNDNPWTQDKSIFRSISEEASAYLQFNWVVCVSTSVEASTARRFGISHACAILNPIDASEIRIKATKDLQERIPRDGFRFVSVGRLVKQKGYDKLIPLIGKLRDKQLDVSLCLVGEGEEFDNLKKITQENHLDNHIYFFGYKKNPYALMNQMDLFVCSSRSEGYSLVIAEALVLGLPVISMNCSGPDQLLEGGKYGVLCDDYEDLARSMEKAVTDPMFLNTLREKAHSRGRCFDIRETVRRVEDLFDETICPPSVS